MCRLNERCQSVDIFGYKFDDFVDISNDEKHERLLLLALTLKELPFVRFIKFSTGSTHKGIVLMFDNH